jgi:hypothetical protein
MTLATPAARGRKGVQFEANGRNDEILEANRRINVLQERWKQIQLNVNRWLEKHPNAWSPFSTLKAGRQGAELSLLTRSCLRTLCLDFV